MRVCERDESCAKPRQRCATVLERSMGNCTEQAILHVNTLLQANNIYVVNKYEDVDRTVLLLKLFLFQADKGQILFIIYIGWTPTATYARNGRDVMPVFARSHISAITYKSCSFIDFHSLCKTKITAITNTALFIQPI